MTNSYKSFVHNDPGDPACLFCPGLRSWISQGSHSFSELLFCGCRKV